MGFTSLRSYPRVRRPSRQYRDRTTQSRRVRGPAVEPLESRQLLSAAPAIVDWTDPNFYLGEGESVTLSGYFTDADESDTSHQVVVDWGDGSESIYLPGAQGNWPVTSGYVNPVNGHAYYMLDYMDWSSAEAYAQSLGGHLASITSQAEQDWAFQTFGTSPWGWEETFYIGLTDADDYSTEGQFVWSSGEDVSYTNWNTATSEPNNAGDEDYAGFWSGNAGRWNDFAGWGSLSLVEVDEPVSFPDAGGSRSFQLSHRYLDDPSTGTAYQITIKVVDGDEVESDPVTATAHVFNYDPYLYLDYYYSGNEGQTINFGGFLSDPGTADDWTVTVDYGDGSGLQTLHPENVGPINLSHAYPDEGTYAMHVSVRDDDSEYPFEQDIQVDVANVAPTLRNLALSSDSADEGQAVTLSGLVGDGGSADALTLTVDWGDGSADTVLHPDAGAPRPFSAAHAYADNGTYNVTVTVEDDSGASVTRNSGGALPDGAVEWGGNGHWYGVIFVGEGTAPAAEAAAIDTGGYLSTITTPGEQEFLNNSFLFADQDGDGYGDDGLHRAYWIGLSDRDVEGTFAWGTGEDLTYQNWDVGEPNDYPWPGGEDYVSMNWYFMMGWAPQPGTWNDVTDTGAGGPALQWAIVEFDAAPEPLTVTVENADPAVAVSGPSLGVPGEPRQFAASVTDPGAADTHTVSWQVLNGTNVVASGGGTTADFTPVSTGTYSVRFTAVDDDGGVGIDSAPLTVDAFNYQADPSDAGKTVLAVGGTAGVDTFVVKPRGGGSVEVVLNDVVLGSFGPTGGVHLFGGAGNDHAVVTAPVPVPVTFFGGEGDDILRSNNFSDTLIGGPGDDRVFGTAKSA